MRIWELFRTALKSNENGPLRKSVALSVYLAVGSISPCADVVSLAVLEAMIYSGGALMMRCWTGRVLVGVVGCSGRRKIPSQTRGESGVVPWVLYVGFFSAGRWMAYRPLIGLFSLHAARGSRLSRNNERGHSFRLVQLYYQWTARRDCKNS
jgi:hypothetical protein